MISLKLPGIPVSPSNTSRTPSGGPFTKSLTSRATLASVLGGKFSELPVDEEPATPTPDVDPERDRVDDNKEGFDDPDIRDEDTSEDDVAPPRLLEPRPEEYREPLPVVEDIATDDDEPPPAAADDDDDDELSTGD